MVLSREELHAALVERHGAAHPGQARPCGGRYRGPGRPRVEYRSASGAAGRGAAGACDFDVVDITNLNRQHYTMHDIGVPKTLALQEQLEAINPYLDYQTHTERIIPANAARLFAGLRCGVRGV